MEKENLQCMRRKIIFTTNFQRLKTDMRAYSIFPLDNVIKYNILFIFVLGSKFRHNSNNRHSSETNVEFSSYVSE